mmetsp:Transcript_29785/g.70137  ORF Transcript_29785/g.70137 Transcript_29785/m.70137 type:complete len:257 (+) Transcript_29785:2337-3107(+)
MVAAIAARIRLCICIRLRSRSRQQQLGGTHAGTHPDTGRHHDHPLRGIAVLAHTGIGTHTRTRTRSVQDSLGDGHLEPAPEPDGCSLRTRGKNVRLESHFFDEDLKALGILSGVAPVSAAHGVGSPHPPVVGNSVLLRLFVHGGGHPGILVPGRFDFGGRPYFQREDVSRFVLAGVAVAVVVAVVRAINVQEVAAPSHAFRSFQEPVPFLVLWGFGKEQRVLVLVSVSMSVLVSMLLEMEPQLQLIPGIGTRRVPR